MTHPRPYPLLPHAAVADIACVRPCRYSYRASKTALNQLTKTMSVEFQRRRQKVACILLHPGTVDTDLSEPFQKVRMDHDMALCVLETL